MNKYDLKWYVLNHSFNDKRVEQINIFDDHHLNEFINEHIRSYTTFDNFKIELNNELRYLYWARAEYEIVIGGLFHHDEDELEKWDIYMQLKPNLDTLARYIINEVNKTKKEKLVIDEK